ncbi:hypothetical protein NFI96_015613, partial [Prochilodus magdalenae]
DSFTSMAITERQAIMVIHPEGITTSAPQASSAHSLFVVLKPLHPGGGGQDEGALLANKEARPLGTSTVGFPKLSSISLSAMAGTNNSNQLWNLPAESTCKSITVTLDNNNMWNEFCRCRTEMILTKQGRRMFPYCRFRISGLEPFQRYTLVMDMHPVDNHRYKWSDRRWETNGKGDPHILRSFVHPESPATGLDWMQNPVSFYKLKLTNNPSDQEGHIIINSMHRYLPRLHIIPADKATDVVQLNGPDVITFSFPQTEFFAVTAYQNLCITQLKIDYNPFAKGFRDATSSRSCKPKNGLSTETVEGEGKPSKETTTLNNLKTLFAKRNAADKVLKGQSLPATPDENLKAVNGDAPKTSELEKSSSKKRPWPEGLSELIKGAHVKKALEIHLGDDAKEEALQKSVENKKDEGSQNIEERIEARIEALEKDLLRDLKIMKHRQVIHPVLQAVGLKLHLLDLTLAIDLQYLGVCLPIPPPAPLHGESSGCSTSSQVPFVSRTGKTTDITKIKGWRDKFTSSSSSSLPGVGTSSDAGQKNLSAFCSDMLDEYLESEGKLIDERAASFSQAVVTPVAYQLPTKSTSYVRTLDSVLKKQAPPTTTATFEPSLTSRKSYRSKELTKLGEIRSKKSKSGAAKTASNTDMPSNVSDKDDSKVEGSSSKKSIKSGASKAVYSDPSAPFSLSPSKKSAKVKTRRGSRNSQASSLADGKPGVNSISMANVAQDSASSTHGGRMTGLSKTLVKLLDVEDGAVWKGRRRTCITEERAAIALSSLVTVGVFSTVKNNPSAIIRRRAPPCLNDFCRLGCVCASLAQERRQHHCGKPQCMLGCDCLRRKVVLLKHSKDEHLNKGAQGQPDENLSEMAKKKRRRKAYSPDPAPEPAIHVKRLWDQKSEADSECLFIPTPARPPRPVLISPELQQDLETFLHPMRNKVMNDGGLRLTRDNESCARMRPFCRKNKSHTGQQTTKGEARLGQEDFIEDIEEGELRPPVLSGPTKRLEIVSKCKWVTAGSRNVVLRVVCERMAQDRLKQPFWVGKYQIQPISKTDEGSTVTYKVSISQPRPVKNDLKKEEENEKIKQLEAQLIKTIGKSEVKGLPLLSQVTPAGLLKAEKKIPGASGQISVNGKSYPQAKLELGQMGALHPANRLAAYITGRVCLDNPNATKTADTAVITASTPMACTTITTAVATTTSVTSTCSSAGTTVKPIVTKPPVGTVFTQVVINHMNSQQQKLPSTSAPQLLGTIKHLFKPPSHSLMTGVTEDSVFSNTPPKASMASWAPATPGPTDGHIHPVDTALSVSGTAAPGKTFVLTPTGSHATTPGAGVRLMEPVTSTQPPVPGQKMVFQMLKTATGGTMYRNPNGQLIQLVPLSQFRALNPNFLIPKQTTIVRFPSPTASKPQNGSSVPTITSSTPTTSTATLRQALTPNAIHSAANLSTTVTSSVTEKPVISLSALGSMSNKPGMVNIAPGFVSNTAKSILKIVTQNLNTDPKQSIITVKTSPSTTQSASNIAPASESIVLITPTSSQKSQNLDLKKSISNVKVGSVPTEGTQKDCPSSSSSKQDSENVVLEDHCYTFETKRTSTSCEKPGDPADASDPTNASKSNMLPKELLEFGPIEEDEVSDAEGEALGSDVRGEAGEDTEEVEIDSDSTELTEDSDMYNNLSEPSDQEDLHIDTDSDNGKKNKQKRDSVDAKMPDLCEKDDELVDVETFEKDENTTASLVLKQQENQQGQRAKEETEDEFLQKKKKQEKERRSTLRERFHNMQITLNLEESKVSKMTILRLAREEINTLRKQSDQLVNMQKKLSRKKAYYLQLASQISGKTEKSISQKLDEIIIKQKFLEGQHRAKDTSPHLTQPVPKSVVWDHLTKRKRLKSKDKVKDISRRHAQLSPNSKPVDHSITKQKKGGRKDISSKKKALDSSEKETNRRPTQLGMKTLSASQSRTRVERSAQLSRERTRPNILSRSKSQTLPESPAKEQAFVPQVIQAVVPCNQIITISNPLQPIGITSLGERQSTTPVWHNISAIFGDVDMVVIAVVITVCVRLVQELHLCPYLFLLYLTPFEWRTQFPFCNLRHHEKKSNTSKILNNNIRAWREKLTLASSPLSTTNDPKHTAKVVKNQLSSVVSLVPPEKRLNTPPVILQKTDLPPAIQTQESCSPVHTDDQQNPTPSNGGAPVVEGQGLDKQALEVVFKPLKQNAKVSMGADVTGVQKEEGKTANSEVEAENLMSLLDELVFLNQQLNDEPSQPQGGDNSLAEEETVRTGLLPEKDAGVDRDDERSLSPLFLRLDEDLMATTTSKDEMDDIPPKVDDLVKVIFGSDSPPSSSESELVVGTNDDGTNVPTCHAKNDAPSPPPLLQMKAGSGGTTANSSKEQASLSWRPMPKLAPLGLKTPEAGQPKATEPSSKPATRLHSAHT